MYAGLCIYDCDVISQFYKNDKIKTDIYIFSLQEKGSDNPLKNKTKIYNQLHLRL